LFPCFNGTNYSSTVKTLLLLHEAILWRRRNRENYLLPGTFLQQRSCAGVENFLHRELGDGKYISHGLASQGQHEMLTVSNETDVSKLCYRIKMNRQISEEVLKTMSDVAERLNDSLSG
jgi:hypothetical protein